MLDSFCPIPECLTTHLSYHQFFFNEAPKAYALIANTKNKQSQGPKKTLLKVLHSCPIPRYSRRYRR
jgi:hypothetical protein